MRDAQYPAQILFSGESALDDPGQQCLRLGNIVFCTGGPVLFSFVPPM